MIIRSLATALLLLATATAAHAQPVPVYPWGTPVPQPEPIYPAPLPQPIPAPGPAPVYPWPQPQPPRPPQPPIYQNAGACFFSERNFRGASFCVDAGDSYSRLRNWDKAIRSVQVFGRASVDLCTDYNFYGNCVTVRRDTGRLPAQLDRRASSLEVY